MPFRKSSLFFSSHLTSLVVKFWNRQLELASKQSLHRLLHFSWQRWRLLLRTMGRCTSPLNCSSSTSRQVRHPLFQRYRILPRPFHALSNRWQGPWRTQMSLRSQEQLWLEIIQLYHKMARFQQTPKTGRLGEGSIATLGGGFIWYQLLEVRGKVFLHFNVWDCNRYNCCIADSHGEKTSVCLSGSFGRLAWARHERGFGCKGRWSVSVSKSGQWRETRGMRLKWWMHCWCFLG